MKKFLRIIAYFPLLTFIFSLSSGNIHAIDSHVTHDNTPLFARPPLAPKKALPPHSPYTLILTLDVQGTTPHFGADLVSSILESYRWGMDKTNLNNSFGGKCMRYGIDYLMTSFMHIVQHEVFGHGARLREFGLSAENYELRFFSGSTTSPTAAWRLHPHAQIMIKAGGMESAYTWAEHVRRRTLQKGTILSIESKQFNMGFHDQTAYAFLTNLEREGNDIRNYVEAVNKTYGQEVVTVGRLRNAQIINVFDPFMYVGFYSIYFNAESVWMIPLTPRIQYLPGCRSLLTPYGLETRLSNFIRFDDRLIEAHIRFGKNAGIASFGIEARVSNLVQWGNLEVGFRGEYWRQPVLMGRDTRLNQDAFANHLKFQDGKTVDREGEIITDATQQIQKVSSSAESGGLLAAHVHFSYSSRLVGNIEFGYKTSGYSIGDPLKAGVIAAATVHIIF